MVAVLGLALMAPPNIMTHGISGKITPGSGSSIIAGKGLTGVLIGVGPFGYTGDGGPAVMLNLLM